MRRHLHSSSMGLGYDGFRRLQIDLTVAFVDDHFDPIRADSKIIENRVAAFVRIAGSQEIL